MTDTMVLKYLELSDDAYNLSSGDNLDTERKNCAKRVSGLVKNPKTLLGTEMKFFLLGQKCRKM